MKSFERCYRLHGLLKNAKRPISRRILEEKLECSRATFGRTKDDLRDFLNAPIDYDRKRNGWHYTDQAFELPGLWLSPAELYALLACQQLLSQTEPGIFDDAIRPIKERFETILAAQGCKTGELSNRIRILRMAHRAPNAGIFKSIVSALTQRQRVCITYLKRDTGERSDREISPQRLIHYRDNWYLDAHCHRSDALRSFALEQIKSAALTNKTAISVADSELDAHYAQGYGIFGGKTKRTAVLKFTPHRAQWVADEHWHPKQQGKFLEDESYELRIPYAEPPELIMDILRYGPEVEVIEPLELRQEVANRLRTAAKIYS